MKRIKDGLMATHRQQTMLSKTPSIPVLLFADEPKLQPVTVAYNPNLFLYSRILTDITAGNARGYTQSIEDHEPVRLRQKNRKII